MSYAPGTGPRLTLEQQFEVEAMTRFVETAPREQTVEVVRKLVRDGIIMRSALLELFEDNASQSEV